MTGHRQSLQFVRDFTRIRVAPDFDQMLTPAVAQCLFDLSVAWLDEQFAQPHDGPTVVVTHFAPARQHRRALRRLADQWLFRVGPRGAHP